MSRTKLPAELTDAGYWRRLLATCHPDRTEDHELFLFLQGLREHVEGCAGARSLGHPGRSGPTRSDEPRPERVRFDSDLGYPDEFITLTHRAISIGKRAGEPYRSALMLLINCDVADHGRRAMRQSRGASYRQLAAIGHGFNMSKAERVRWYEICRAIPLSESHAAHILGRVQRAAA